MNSLPRGIWYEPQWSRYRVRLYKNKVPHLLGYFPTEESAREGLRQLRAKLDAIPKKKRGTNAPKAMPSATSLTSLARQVREARDHDPRSFTTRIKH